VRLVGILAVLADVEALPEGSADLIVAADFVSKADQAALPLSVPTWYPLIWPASQLGRGSGWRTAREAGLFHFPRNG